MAQTLGSLLVELGLNQAKFQEGMGKAATTAREGAGRIKEALGGIGTAFAGITSQFGAFGGAIGVQLAGVSSALREVTRGMDKAASSLGMAGAGLRAFGALAAAAAAASAAVVAIGVHAASAGAKIYLLAQSTGVSVEALSGLGIIAKAVDVPMHALGMAMMRLTRSAEMAAMAPQSTGNAYRLMGIQVTDATGHLKPTIELFGEVADKFSQMKDSSQKTALAMLLFGRASTQIVPMLNMGREALKYWIDYGERVGAILTDKEAKGAEDFQEQLIKLSLAAQGIENRIMIGLLPALNSVVGAFADLAGHGPDVQSFGKIVGDAMIHIAEGVLRVAESLVTLKRAFSHWKSGLAVTAAGIAEAAGAHALAVQIAVHTPYKPGDLEKRIEDALAELRKMETNPPPMGGKTGEPPKPTQPGIVAPPAIEYVNPFIDKTVQATAAAEALALSTGKETAALARQKAEAQAANEILGVRIRLTQQLEEYETEVSEALRLGQTNRAEEYTFRVQGLQKQLQHLDAMRGSITKMYEAAGLSKFVAGIGVTLQKQTDDMQDHLESLRTMLTAIPQGGAALRGAEIEQKLIPLREKLADATAALAQAENADADTKRVLQVSVDRATVSLEKYKKQLQEEQKLTFAIDMEKETRAMNAQVTALAIETEAIGKNAAAKREAAVQAKMVQWQAAHPEATAEQIAQQSELLHKLSDAQHLQAVAEAAAGMNARKVYADKEAMLNEIIATYGRTSDAGRAAMAQEHDDFIKMEADASEMAIRFGSLKEALAGFGMQIVLQGENARGRFFTSMKQGLDSLESSMARFIVTGKGGFIGVLREMEMTLVKLGIQFLITAAMKRIFDAQSAVAQTAGLGQSQVVRQSAIGQSGAEAATSAAWAGPGAAIAAAALTIGTLEGITALAAGGDVTPGRAYIVGERRPELFVPSMPGRVHSSVPREMGQGGGETVHIHHSFQASAFDTENFDSLIERNAKVLEKHIERAIRKQNF